MSLRIVFDTNIRFSALLFRGTPAILMAFVHAAGFTELISQALLDELQDVLERKSRREPEFIAAHLAAVRAKSTYVLPQITVAISRDPDDDRILECAVAGRANLIVTGDLDLLRLKSFHGIPILTHRQCIDRLSTPYTP